ncbi:MAG: carboxypeptidase regulatory-like domain-containing protein, partial [Calditrichaeota bacterium]|nr:carboxypeptidase regulatory-like domain-containing protein [Calditrichota bacterium]
MKSFHILTLAVLLLLLSGSDNLTAQISVDPLGFSISMDENAEQDVELVLSNSGESEVAFWVSCRLDRGENEQRGGPRRDDLGDIIHEFDVPNGGADEQKVGVGWDSQNEWMWISNWPNSSVAAVDPNNDYDVARELDIQNPWNVTCMNGHLYVVSNALNPIYHYDTEGENLGDIDVGFNVSSISRSEEMGLLFLTNDAGRAIHVFTVQENGEPDDQIGVIPSLAALCGDDNRYRAICWVDVHEEGQFWLSNPSADAEGCRLWQILINTDNWEPVELVSDCEIWPNCAQNRQRQGLGHDGTNMWTTSYNSATVRIIDDDVVEFGMLTIVPEESSIPGNDSETVTFTINTEGNDAGVYNILIDIDLEEVVDERDDLEETNIQIAAVVSVASPTSGVSGTVIRADNDAPLEDVFIELDRYLVGVYTDDEGNYSLTDLPLGEYELTFTATDFLPTTEAINLEEDNIELNVALLQARCRPSRDDFIMELEPDMEYDFDFQITNDGNGPLSWSVERNIPEVRDLEMWEMRSDTNAQEIVEDDMLNGVVFIDGYFYISGGNNGNNPNKIYVLNMDREVVDEFDQFADDRYGLRDLAYDGELIWGVVLGTFYGFTTDGNQIKSFECPVENIAGRSLAWDSEDSLLWVTDISSDIYGINTDGDLVRTIENNDLRIYGLGYWQEDPDDYNLYVFCQGPDNIGITVYKLDLDNGDYREVTYLDVEESRPGGLQITNQLDVYSWVVIALNQNPDRLTVWQLATNYEWFRITPVVGVIEPAEREYFVLT